MEPQQGELGPPPGTQAYDDWLHSPARHFDHQKPFHRLFGLCIAAMGLQALLAGLVWDSFRWSSAGLSVVASTLLFCVSSLMLVTLAHRQLRDTRWQIDRVTAQTTTAATWAHLNGSLGAALLVLAIVLPSAILLWAVRALLIVLLAIVAAFLKLLSVTMPRGVSDRLQRDQPPLLPPVQPPPAALTQPASLFVPPPWLGSALVAMLVLAAVVFLLWRLTTRRDGLRGLWLSIVATTVRAWNAVRALMLRVGSGVRTAARLAVGALRRTERQQAPRQLGRRGERLDEQAEQCAGRQTA